jgi:hypothetical protein
MNKQKKRRIKWRLIVALVIILIIIICVVIQSFFMPEWQNGNTNSTIPADDGVHTQETTAFNEFETTQKIVVN